MADDKALVDAMERIGRELKQIRELVTKAVNAMGTAETEVPEQTRRFVTYMHDMHDVANIYIERGQPVPHYINRELERCDDRMRQILETLHTDGGAFEKVRREMADDPANRWDHTRQLKGSK